MLLADIVETDHGRLGMKILAAALMSCSATLEERTSKQSPAPIPVEPTA